MRSCPETRWVLAGYSQGAMVVTEAAKSFQHDKVVYIALFGDPQLNLPEGKGLLPVACLGRNYSPYRVNVPNCRTNRGSLGERNPYEYGELVGKYGLWCNEKDVVCGSTHLPWEFSGHLTYSERMTQLVGILRGLLPYRTRAAPNESRAFALLSLDTYYARPGEIVTLDASASFSLDVDICDYAWSIDGEVFWSSGYTSFIERSFAASGTHTVTVRVTDWLDETSEYTSEIRVIEGDAIVAELASPVGVTARVDGEDVLLDWSASEVLAPYIMVRLNNYDLGYAEATRGFLRVSDVDLSDTNSFEVAWLSEETASDWAVAEWITENSPDEYYPPNTGVTFAEGILPCFAMLACLVAIWILLK